MDNHEMIGQLVKCYETKRLLWDSKHPEYYNKYKREDLWREISLSMNVSVKDLKKKMTSLLGSYRRERSREKKSQVTGSGQGDVYKSKWFGYTLFDFLSNKDMPNDTFDTMENANTQRGPEENRKESYNDESIVDEPATVEDEPPASTNTTMASVTVTAASTSTATAPTSNISQARKRKRRNDADNAQNEMLLNAYSILKKTSATPTDHYETFGMHVASELRKYDSNTLPHVKRAILDVLFRADIGEFTPNHNVRNTSGYYSSCSTPTQSSSGSTYYPPTPTPPPSDAVLEIESRPPQQEDTLLHYLTNVNPEEI